MNAPLIPVQVGLDAALYQRASAIGTVGEMMADALRDSLSPETAARRRRWAEEHALLIEALAAGVEELAVR